MECWYRIPDARYFRVMRANLGRLSTFESIWEAWCDPIRVLIRVLQDALESIVFAVQRPDTDPPCDQAG